MSRIPTTRGARPPARVRWAEGLLLAGIAILLLSRAAEGPVPPAPDASGLSHRVDPNRAGWRDLADLPGIGETRARAIVAERERNGPYVKPEDLTRVRGIGPVTVTRIRDHLAGLAEDR